MSFSISVPAKINLWLEVIRRREDGYHELSSLMLPVGIWDHLELEWRAGGEISLECDAAWVPSDSRNLAWKAAQLYGRAAGLEKGVHLRLRKNIPAGAGLGGGSADAAGVLCAMNRMNGDRLSERDLHGLARSLGADVPFFLHPRPALATGVGEHLSPVEGVPSYPLVLIKPPVAVSTAGVYQRLALTRGRSRIKVIDLLTRPWQLHAVMENDLESVTLEEYPVLARIKKWLLENGASGALMSGSGSTVFGVFPETDRSVQAGALAQQVWKESWVAVTEVLGTSISDRPGQ